MAAEAAKQYPDRPYLIEFDMKQLLSQESAAAVKEAGGLTFGGGVETGGTSLIPLAKLLPARPAVGGQPHDFQLTWDFVLLGPEDARQVLLAEANQKNTGKDARKDAKGSK